MVRSAAGSAVSGVKITLTNEETFSTKSTITSQDGKYIFTRVEPGNYALGAESQGFEPATRQHVAVNRNQPVTADFTFAPSQPAEARTDRKSPGPNSLSTRADYYDETPLKSSAVSGSVDPGGYSSPGQAQTSRRLLQGVTGLRKNSAAPDGVTGSQPEVANPKALAAMEAELKKVAENAPRNYEVNRNLGEFYLHAGQLQAGIPYLEKAQRIDHSHYDNGYNLALAYLETGNLASARSQIQQMIARQDTAELHGLLGEVEENAANYITAVNEYERAAHMEPSEGNLFDWGRELLIHQTFEPAIEVFSKGVDRYPRSPKLQIGLGVALYSRGRYDEAVKALCAASDLTPSDPRPYLFLGRMYDISIANASEVTKRLERFVTIQPQNPLAHYYYAMSLWKGQRGQNGPVNIDQTESLLKSSISLDPKFPDAHLEVGILYAEQGNYPEAIREYQEAIKLQPDLLDAHYRLAQAFTRTGEQALAQEEFKLHERLRKQQMLETEKKRAEIKQFIYSMKDSPRP